MPAASTLTEAEARAARLRAWVASHASPAAFATLHSRGRWHSAPHLEILSDKLREAVLQGGKRIMVWMPPRHGKSELVSAYTPSWVLDQRPSAKVMLCSYAAQFAARWGRRNRNLAVAPAAPLRFALARDSQAADEWETTAGGGMKTAGIGGDITGRGFDLGLIDDPCKNAEEAWSETVREAQWDWWRSTFYPRAEPGASVVIVQTRWHEDDLSGRILAESSEPWEVISFPAIAEEADVLGRRPGEALWPERWPLTDLERIRGSVGEWTWSALYQQQPVPRSGGMFLVSRIQIVAPPGDNDYAQRVRYWDKAGTPGGDGAYTVGVLMARTRAGRYWVLDVVRGRWDSAERETVIHQTAMIDGHDVEVGVEQEPGSGGKESAQATVRRLAGYRVRVDRPSGDKVLRADPFSAQVNAENVFLAPGAWNRAYVNELQFFPAGRYKDQVDASSGAFALLAQSRMRPGGLR